MKQKDFIKRENKKREARLKGTTYEALLYYNGSIVESIKTPNYTTFRGEFGRMLQFEKKSSNYKVEANIYALDGTVFEKRIY